MPKKEYKARILVLDIETSPNVAYTWGLWKENIGIDQLIKPSEMICWAAKWYGEKKMFYRSVYHDGKKKMLKDIYKLLDEAEAVIHFNGQAFDIPTVRTMLFINNLPAPSPFKHIDLMSEAKRVFRFQSNKLEFILRQTGLGGKNKTEFELWVKCIKNDPKAWAEMKAYNIVDVEKTEALYKKMMQWIGKHPTLYAERDACPYCGSHNVQYRGSQIAVKWKWKRYQCQECARWYTGNREDRGEATHGYTARAKSVPVRK